MPLKLVDFLAAATSGTDLKSLSKMLKELPQEDRPAAGKLFQEVKAKYIKSPPSTAKHWTPTGRLLWSLDVGPFGHGATMYEDELLVGTSHPNKMILITGQNLAIKEIKI